MTETAGELDVRGLTCSDAVVKLHRALAPLPGGATVRVVVDAADVIADLRKYARRGGHAWGEPARRPDGTTEVGVTKGA